MTSNKNNQENIENQDIEMNEGFTSDNDTGSVESDTCDNLTEDSDAVSEGYESAQDESNPVYQAALWKEKYMRLSAEYDNYRKRTFKEKMDIINAGGEDVVRSMLDVLDDMDRALVAMVGTDDMEAVRQGITLIDTKLRGALKSRGLAEIEAVGAELDTDLHEAVARIAVEEHERKGRIIDVVQKGYKLRDKIIRYAKVVVGQ
jgi:molecular chaperone GrpE